MTAIDLTPPDCLFEQLKVAANATLTFLIAGSGESTTSPTGNPIPATPETTKIEAICHFDKKPNGINEQFMKGVDQRIVWISGRCINPKSFPAGVTHLKEGTIVINGRTGKIKLFNPHLNPHISDTLGMEFYATFLEGEVS